MQMFTNFKLTICFKNMLLEFYIGSVINQIGQRVQNLPSLSLEAHVYSFELGLFVFMVKEYRLWSSKVFPQITVGMENNALFSGAIENAEKFSANVSRKHSKIIWNIILYCFLFLFSLISPLLLFIFFLPFVLSFIYSFFFLSFFFCFSFQGPKKISGTISIVVDPLYLQTQNIAPFICHQSVSE